jgi:hypothetical protein
LSCDFLDFSLGLTFDHDQFQVQSENWMYDYDACGRPHPESQQSIICAACFNTADIYLTGTAGGDFDLFSDCCPVINAAIPTSSNRTVYYSSSRCLEYCLTNNETIADGWDQCIKNAVSSSNLTLANATVDEAYCGRCEYLDKNFLKNGLKSSAGSVKGTAALLLTSLVFGFMLI